MTPRLCVLLVLLVVMSIVAARTALAPPGYELRPYHWFGAPPDALRVAWVGNSHTYVNQVPFIVQAMGEAYGASIWIDGVARPGFTLEQHYTRGLFEELLQSPFHVVVLQEQSGRSHNQPEPYARAASYFAKLAHSKGARVVLMGAWAYESSPDRPQWTEASASAQERRTTERVLALARQLGADAAPVGRAFTLARAALPGARMTQTDGNHTTLEGAYLQAAVLYLAITGVEIEDALVLDDFGVAPELQSELWRIARRASELGMVSSVSLPQ